MVNVLTDITINCPRERVSDFASNPDSAPKWYVNIKAVEWKTPKPLTIGTKVAFKAYFLGRELSYIYEITEYIPGIKLVMKTADGPFPMKTTYTWETVDGNSTRMTLRNEGVPSGFSALVTPFMSIMMKRANKKDLKKIKSLLEKETM
jgi:uncharacterized membrane protein